MAPRTRTRKQSNADTTGKRKRDDIKSEDEPPVKASKIENEARGQTAHPSKDKTEDEHQIANSSSPSITKAQSPSPSPSPAPKTKKQSSPASTVKWLLSDEAFQLANPPVEQGHGEVDWGQGEDGRPRPDALPPVDEEHSRTKSKSEAELEDGGLGGFQYPQPNMTPYQSLLSSLLLSKPLSHRLGTRTINTLFNPPYSFDKFSNLSNATEDERRASLWAARTQHKEKTATQLTSLVQSVKYLSNERGEDELSILRDEIKGLKKHQAIDWIGKRLTKDVNGIGKGGVDIFCRRVQGSWEELYPFADARTLAAARQLGLLHQDEKEDGAEELVKLITNGEDVDVVGKEQRERFVRLLDVLIGLDLEKKIEQVKDKLGI